MKTLTAPAFTLVPTSNPTKKSSISKSSMAKSSSRRLQQWKDWGMYKIVSRFKVFYWGNSFHSLFLIIHARDYFIEAIQISSLHDYYKCVCRTCWKYCYKIVTTITINMTILLVAYVSLSWIWEVLLSFLNLKC